MPGQSVAPQDLAVGSSNVGNNIGIGVGKGPSTRLDVGPLLAILWDELANFCLVVDDVHVARVAAVAIVEAGTEVLEAGGDGEVVQLGRGRGAGG